MLNNIRKFFVIGAICLIGCLWLTAADNRSTSRSSPPSRGNSSIAATHTGARGGSTPMSGHHAVVPAHSYYRGHHRWGHFYPTWWVSWNSTFFWEPYWWPNYYPYYSGYYSHGGLGEIKIDTKDDDAEVFVDGAYAGIVKDLHHLRLEPGVYNLELKTTDNLVYKKRVYVLSGKTVKITPVFTPAEGKE